MQVHEITMDIVNDDIVLLWSDTQGAIYWTFSILLIIHTFSPIEGSRYSYRCDNNGCNC